MHEASKGCVSEDPGLRAISTHVWCDRERDSDLIIPTALDESTLGLLKLDIKNLLGRSSKNAYSQPPSQASCVKISPRGTLESVNPPSATSDS